MTASDTKKQAILIIEDDPHIAGLLKIHLGDLGFDTEVAGEGQQGLVAARTGRFSLIILDLMLPGMDGLEVCKKIRTETATLPIIMLTSKSDELDKVLGLELGADDYITKPFSIRELQARVKAVFRRVEVEKLREEQSGEDTLHFGDLTIEISKRKVTLRGTVIDLTAKEWELLLLFAENPGRVYNRMDLLDLVWGYQYEGYSHTVNSHINRLRNKIEADPALPFYIRTKRGLGYHFVDRDELS